MTRHLPALDGIRAIAISWVMMKHLWYGPYVPGLTEVAASGAYGVDVFFVLSGFLITGILLRTKGKPRFYKNFYIRRALRILPLYWGYLTLVFGTRLLAVLLTPEDFPPAAPAWTYFLFVSNIWFAQQGAFVDEPLGISWSLCIEEQFYLLFPLLVAVLSRRALVVVLAVVALGSGPLRYLTYDPTNPIATYVLMPLRADGLAMGGLAACAWQSRHEGLTTWSRWLVGPATLAIVAMLATHWIGQDQGPIAVGHAVVSLWTVCLVGLSLTLPEGHPVTRTLSWSWLAYVGTVSYGLYLLHPVALIISRLIYLVLGLPDVGQHAGWAALQLVLSVSLSMGLAVLSWRTVEAPFLALKSKWAPSQAAA